MDTETKVFERDDSLKLIGAVGRDGLKLIGAVG